MPENIATLGFEFDSKSTGTKLSNLIKKLEALEAKGQSTKGVLQQVFGRELPGLSESLAKINSLNVSFKITGSAIQKISRSIGSINRSLNQLNLKALNPLPANAAQNLERNAERMIASLNKVGTRLQDALTRIHVRPINPVAEDAVQRVERMARLLREIRPAVLISPSELKKLEGIEKALSKINRTQIPMPDTNKADKAVKHISNINDELSVMSIHADAGMVAVNGLINSLTGKFFIDAIRNVTALGRELAMIRSIAAEYDTEEIAASLMSMPSILGRAEDHARATYEAISSGIGGTGKQMADFERTIAMLSQTIRAELAPTMDAVTTIINAYGLGVRDAGKVADIMFSIVKFGKASGQQLATGLGQVASTARTAGLSLEELGASITVLSKIMQSRNAITYLNNMLSKLINPTQAAKEKAREYGIELGLAAVQARGFTNVLRDIYAISQQDQSVLLEFFGDARGQRAALQLLGEGYSDLQQQIQNFQNSAGEMGNAFSIISDDKYHQIAALPETFRKITQAAGETTIEVLTLGGALDPLIRGFNSLDAEAYKYIGHTVLLVGAYTAYKAVCLTLISYQAMMAKNEQILAAQKEQNAAASASLVAADDRYAAVFSANHASKVKELALLKKEADSRLKNIRLLQAENEKKIEQLKSESQGNPTLYQYVKLKELEAEKRRLNKEAIEAETQAQNASKNYSDSVPFDSRFAFSHFRQSDRAISDVSMKAQAAQASALHAAAMSNEAAAAGDLVTAEKMATVALKQYAIQQKYARLEAQLQTMQLKANTAAQKAANAQTRLGAGWHKLHAQALRAGIVLWKGFRVATIAATAAMKQFARSTIVLAAIQVALEALIWLWNKLDLTGKAAAEAQMDRISEIQEEMTEEQQELQQQAQEASRINERLSTMAQTLISVNGESGLSAENFELVAAMAREVNGILGEQVVTIDKANKRISIQGDLMAKVAGHRRQSEIAAARAQLAQLEARYAEAKRIWLQTRKVRAAEWFWVGQEEEQAFQKADAHVKSIRQQVEAQGQLLADLERMSGVEAAAERVRLSQQQLDIERQILAIRQAREFDAKSETEKLNAYLTRIAELETILNAAANQGSPGRSRRRLRGVARLQQMGQNLSLEDRLKLEKELDDLYKNRDRLEAQRAQALQRLEEYRAEREYAQMNHSQQMVKTREKITQLQGELSRLTAETTEHSQKALELEKEREKLRQLEAQRAQALQRLAEYRAEREYAQMSHSQQMVKTQEKITQLENELSGLTAETTEHSQKALEIEKEREKLRQLEAQRAQALQRLEEARAKQSFERLTAEGKIVSITTQIAAMTRQISGLGGRERAEAELRLLELQNQQQELINQKEKEFADLREKHLKAEEKMLENINRLREKQFNNQLDFARNDYEKMRIAGRDVNYFRRILELDLNMRPHDIEGANESFWNYYNALEQRYQLQKQLADAERNANKELVNLIASMDKFKSTAVGVVEANSIQALELQSRQFAKMPEMKFESREQSFQERRERELQQLLSSWQIGMEEMLGDTQRANRSQERDLRGLIRVLRESGGNSARVVDAIEKIQNLLNGTLNVKISDSLFEAVNI